MKLIKRHGRSIPKPGKSLADTHPHLAKEYSDKNPLPATQVKAGTRKKIWWVCSICGRKWKASGFHRSKENGTGCPNFSKHPEQIKQKLDKIVGKSLAVTHPELAKEYSEKNSLPASQIVAGTGKKLLWNCSVCGYEWKATGANRVRGSGCPNHYKHHDKCLAVTHPELAREYSDKNTLTALQVGPSTLKKLWWNCSVCGHVWRASGRDRMKGTGCPNYRKHPGWTNPVKRNIPKPGKSLADTHPHLAREYSEKNSLPASQIVAGTRKKLWWNCSVCGYEWQSRGFSRVQGYGCPNYRKHPDK
ncbi:zinc-ribbon domain-containing protein [Candidatus Falkowbacteria bacterium]|nr:zinc-ribbon domain-containing protein [Candidatus Falkowbacteria bacterium]